MEVWSIGFLLSSIIIFIVSICFLISITKSQNINKKDEETEILA